jgi:threonyl-tRNA synthetase
LWEKAQNTLRELVVERIGKETTIGIGEAAFYGPKIDFMAKDAIGREHQVATIQLDFNQPERFDLSCINEEGVEERILMIHAAIAGSFERFLSVMIEHTAGNFPIWLAPEQVRFITVNQEHMTIAAAEEMENYAKKLGVRTYTDNANESVSKKIRMSSKDKVPYTIVIGEREVSNGILSPRLRRDIVVMDVQSELHYEQFLHTVANETKARVNKSSL